MEKSISRDFWEDLTAIEQRQLYQLHRLLKIMGRLRIDCPWDREQTHDSLKPYLLEETYEVLEQLEKKNLSGLKEELGDLLLQVIFHAQIAAEAENFTIEDIAKGIGDKLVRRHPHIFGDVIVKNVQDVSVNWQKIKTAEKKEQGIIAKDKSLLDQVNSYQPALIEAQEIQVKAGEVGFDWDDIQDALKKVEEELAELVSAHAQNDHLQINEEIGDLLFAVVNVARFAETHSELALRATNQKFRRRFRFMEEQALANGEKMEDLILEVLDEYWNEAKKKEVNVD